MGILKLLPLLALVYLPGTLAVWTLEKMATRFVPADYINANEASFTYNGGGANSVAYEPLSSFAYVGGDKWMQVVDFSRFRNPDIVHKIKSTNPITDVAQCGYLVAWVTRGAKITDPGTIHVWDLYRRMSKRWNQLCTGQVGANPVSIKFFHNCQTIVVANKGTPGEDPVTPGTFADPEGTISIVRMVNDTRRRPNNQNPRRPTTQGNCAAGLGHVMSIMSLDFKQFNQMNQASIDQYFPGLRLPYDGSLSPQRRATFSQGIEPTYVTADPSFNDTAYISLRENNAIVQINLSPGNEGINGINPLVPKLWMPYNLDASSTQPGKISFGKYDITSLRQPNAIEPYEVWYPNNMLETYLFTADEGAPTKYTMDNGQKFSDAMPASGIQNPPRGLGAALTNPAQLGNLEVSRVDGLRNPNNTNSGYEYLSFFGGRGISMFKFNNTNSRLELFWDSGDAIGRAVAEFYPAVFNSRSWTADAQSHGPVSQKDQASTKRGSQCKSLAVASIDPETTLVFTGVDGSSVIGIFSVSSNARYPKFESVYRKAPIKNTFSILMDSRRLGDLDPSKLVFIPKSKTPDNFNYLMVMGEKSGTLSMYRILNQPRQIMMNRLRKEARENDAAALGRSVPVLIASLLCAALVRLM